MKLKDKVAVVTGGGSGIGEAICSAFGDEGALVVVMDVDSEAAQRVAGGLNGGAALQADVSNSDSVDDAFRKASEQLGPVDILVNNAGVGDPDLVHKILPRIETQLAEAATGAISTGLGVTVEMSDEEWRRMLSVHLDGTFYCTRAALETMVPRGAGAIINIASICGLEGCEGYPHYSAAKGGILAFTRSVAREVIRHGIRVNAIAPGYIDTPMADPLSPTVRAVIGVQCPLGRWGRPEEIAPAAVFLASEDSSFVVGATLNASGGFVTAV